MRPSIRSNRGLTLVEITVASVVLLIISFILIQSALRSRDSEQLGSAVLNTQKVARQAATSVAEDLRNAGFGIDQSTYVPIEVASEQRVTFLNDRNGNGTIEPGERITYFLDDNTGDANVQSTPNPHDRVLRRLVSTVANPMATPASGRGQLVAVGLTQREDTTRVPLFTYLDKDGNALTGSGDDPTGAEFGKTLAADVLGIPPGSYLSKLTAIRVNAVAEGAAPWKGVYHREQVSETSYLQNTNLFSTAGVWGGHVDVDTSSELYPFNNGSTDVHEHEYDKKYGTTSADYFNLPGSLHNIHDDITDTNMRFKIIVANANLSPAAVLTINGISGTATVYDDQALADLPIYSLSGWGSTEKLTQLKLTFPPDAVEERAIHPSNTGDVRKNVPGKFGEWRNGALTIQAIAVAASGDPLSPTDPSISAGGVQGVATGDLLWETTVFWHWGGPSYHEDGWDTYDPTS